VGALLHHTQAAEPASGSKSNADDWLASRTKPLEEQVGQKPDPDKLMTPGEVLSVFDKNEAAGEDRFLGKKVRLSGKAYKVQRVGLSGMAPLDIIESDQNYFVLTLLADRADGVGTQKPGGNRNRKLQPMAFVFPVSSRKQLAGLEEGQEVTIEGVCQGRKDGDIAFTGCQIVKSK
jgi:hypothetical protein